MSNEEPKVITVRLSPTLLAEFRKLAFARETSMNVLCTSMIANAVQRWRDEQEAIENGCDEEPLDLAVGIEYGLFGPGDTGNDELTTEDAEWDRQEEEWDDADQ